MGDLKALNNDRAWAAGEIRRLADEIEAGQVHAVQVGAIYISEVAADENRSAAMFHWVADDIFNSNVIRHALSGLAQEISLRVVGFTQWDDFEE